MRFTYKCGDAPLEGYTIKRGLGIGGFGEVYLGISEGGKLVALKLIRKASEKERRGISHCLNLKHQNLVHLYDLKQDNEHRHWLVMEYVQGDSLKRAIRNHAGQIPRALAHQWFLELCKGVSFLHDQGVIHRDLKPDNIFLEQGSVKLGDYGLCKAVSAENLESATGHIGTAMYMAPEVWRNKSGVPVDVYACGVILYELLSGRPPFQGTSHELMVAHTSNDPDYSGTPPEYHRILRRALHKDPAKRYPSVAELARDVLAIANATDATLASDVAATPTVVPVGPSTLEPTTLNYSLPPIPVPQPQPYPTRRAIPPTAAEVATESWRDRLGSLAVGLMGSTVLALVVAFLGGFAHHADEGYLYGFGRCFFLTVAISWAVLVTGRLLEPSGRRRAWGYRLLLATVGAMIGFGLIWLDGWGVELSPTSAANPEELHLWGTVGMHPQGWADAMSFAIYVGLALGLVRWSGMVGRDREDRFSGFAVGETAFWGVILWFIWSWADPPTFTVAALIGSAVIVQAVSPWSPARDPEAPRRRLRLAA